MPMAAGGRRRKTDSTPAADLAGRLASLRGRWYTVSAAELLVLPPGVPPTDGTFARGAVFAVADGVDDVAGSGSAALAEVVSRMHPLSDDRRLKAVLVTASWSLRSSRAGDGERGAASVTVAFWTGFRFVVGNVGDCRAYLWRNAVLEQLTRDQYHPPDLLLPTQNGIGGDQHAAHQAADDDDRRVVRLGQAAQGQFPEVLWVTVEPGDRLILCTDGLWRTLTDEELAGALSRPPGAACAELRRLLQSRSRGNGAAVIVAIDPAEPPLPARATRKVTETRHNYEPSVHQVRAVRPGENGVRP